MENCECNTVAPEFDAKNYKFRFFYYNPDDKRAYVPCTCCSRCFQLNFAQPLSWWTVAAAFVVPYIFTHKQAIKN